jgi:DNA-binding CsgD family transcriptional regulator
MARGADVQPIGPIHASTLDVAVRGRVPEESLGHGTRPRLASALERLVAMAPIAFAALATVLEHLGAAAFLVCHDGRLLHANSAGRKLHDASPDALLRLLRSALENGGRDGFAVTRLAVPGFATHFLVLRREPAEHPQSRARRLRDRWSLTQRQTEVLALVARGLANKAVATVLECGESTIEMHVTRLLEHARCGSRSELVARFWTS